MSIKAYVGRMGSGKTYEVVSSVIVSALSRGRRVVSNIAGLNVEEIRELLLGQGIALEKIGELVQVDHNQVLSPFFWRSDKPIESFSSAAAPSDYFIQPGDLVALDEIWRFWNGFSPKDSEGVRRPESVFNFFRMHRHFTHAETGVSCDVALITQDVMDLSRSIRAVIEETYCMNKLTAIGSKSRYRVDIFQGGKTTGKPLRSIQRSYDSAFFPLYSSHSQKKSGGADAVEENIDDRGNLLKGALFRIVLPVGAVVMIGAVWLVWGFFHPKPKEFNQAKLEQNSLIQARESIVSNPPTPDVSADWRIVGYYENGSGFSLYLSNGHLPRVLHNPPAYKVTGLNVEAFLPSGEAVASWSGGGGSSLVLGAKK